MNVTILSLFPWLSTQLFFIQSDDINVFLVHTILFGSSQGIMFCFYLEFLLLSLVNILCGVIVIESS